MGATVQSKTYFPGSMTDLNKSFYNGDCNQYHDDKSQKISGSVNGQHYDYLLMTHAMDGYSGYGKAQIRQTILKHESVFKHQLQELHRLYKKQRDMMNPVTAETSNLGHYLSQPPSDISKGAHIFASGVPLVDSSFDNPFSPISCIKGKSTLNHFGPVSSKNCFPERIVIDLELPAEVAAGNFRKQKAFNLADLNEPVQVEERETAFSAFFSNKNGTSYLAEEPQKRVSSAKRTLFGVEIDGSNQTPSFVLPRRNNTCVQNPSTFHHNNHWLYSSDLTSQNTGFVAGNSRLTASSTKQNSSTGFSFLNGINSKDSLSNSRDEIYAHKKHTFLDMWKNRDTPQQTLPSWLTEKPCLQNERIKVKETPVHHFNLDSLQNQSQQFFKKTEMTEANGTYDFKKHKVNNNTQTITKILGVPIIDKKVEIRCEAKDIRHHIDLNLSLDEDDSPPSLPESVVKIATMEIDLEAPAVESDTDSGSMDNTHMELVKLAAKAIVSISISQPPCKPSSDTLMWFAEIITSDHLEKSFEPVSEDMDYFEYMTLKLEDSKEIYDCYKATIVEKEQKVDDSGSLSKRSPRKGQGRRGRVRKDFQKDILPSIVSLSRREVTEDLQVFEEVFSTTGVSWQSSLSKRKAAARNGRSKRRRQVMADTPPTPVSAGGEKSICREMSLEKSLGGWGRRTRRLPRQRCQNGGNHTHSLALKC